MFSEGVDDVNDEVTAWVGFNSLIVKPVSKLAKSQFHNFSTTDAILQHILALVLTDGACPSRERDVRDAGSLLCVRPDAAACSNLSSSEKNVFDEALHLLCSSRTLSRLQNLQEDSEDGKDNPGVLNDEDKVAEENIKSTADQ